ncbi:MAG TPA: hypothetical protein VFT06_05570 [Flavisolibacter sp.]|nr:hypothetical protein [Flavisolibacter sp.]
MKPIRKTFSHKQHKHFTAIELTSVFSLVEQQQLNRANADFLCTGKQRFAQEATGEMNSLPTALKKSMF